MRHVLPLSLAFAACALVVAGCGGSSGGGGNGSGLPAAPSSPGMSPSSLTLAIKIPSASSSSAARHGSYISPNTQSLGVVVTNQGFSPTPAQFVNVAACPVVSGVTTCTVSILAQPGTDVFTITAYSGQNGTGSPLSTATLTQTIVSGTTAPFSVSLGGIASTVSIVPGIASLPLGQSTTLTVVVKDASGATIAGTYAAPVTLSLSNANLVLGTTSIPDSATGANVSATWAYGFAGSTPTTVTATSGTTTGSLAMTPATGIAFYQTGTNPTNDVLGFKMIANGGKLYYTTLGQIVCSPTTGFCRASTGSVHQFDPSTSTDVEVDLQSEGVGLFFSSDNALWIAGGPVPQPSTGPYIYRMAPGQFASAALTAIPVPTASPNLNYVMRTFAEDGAGQLWFQDMGGHRLLKIPVAGPYTAASIVASPLPTGPPGTAQTKGSARNVDFAGGVLAVQDFPNGTVDVVNPSTSLVSGQYKTALESSLASPQYVGSGMYDSANDGTSVYIAEYGDGTITPPQGALERFDPIAHTFTLLPLVHGPQGYEATATSVNGSLVYTADLSEGGLELVNLTANTSRLYPMTFQGQTSLTIPNGVAALSDGSAWFTCYSQVTATFQPLCIGHTIYLSGWSVFPGYTIPINGAGPANAQLVGIMESPATDSSPFTVTSTNTSVCTTSNLSDHNFWIVGVAPGACSVTVTDKNALTRTINVTVTTTSGTVQTKRREEMP